MTSPATGARASSLDRIPNLARLILRCHSNFEMQLAIAILGGGSMPKPLAT
jgi:hypothetical protein